MNVSLTPELEHFIQEKVDSGLYNSASEVVRESLRLLSTYEDLHKRRLEQLNQAIDVGLKELKEGRGVPADEAYARTKKKIMSMKKNRA